MDLIKRGSKYYIKLDNASTFSPVDSAIEITFDYVLVKYKDKSYIIHKNTKEYIDFPADTKITDIFGADVKGELSKPYVIIGNNTLIYLHGRIHILRGYSPNCKYKKELNDFIILECLKGLLVVKKKFAFKIDKKGEIRNLRFTRKDDLLLLLKEDNKLNAYKIEEKTNNVTLLMKDVVDDSAILYETGYLLPLYSNKEGIFVFWSGKSVRDILYIGSEGNFTALQHKDTTDIYYKDKIIITTNKAVNVIRNLYKDYLVVNGSRTNYLYDKDGKLLAKGHYFGVSDDYPSYLRVADNKGQYVYNLDTGKKSIHCYLIHIKNYVNSFSYYWCRIDENYYALINRKDNRILVRKLKSIVRTQKDKVDALDKNNKPVTIYLKNPRVGFLDEKTINKNTKDFLLGLTPAKTEMYLKFSLNITGVELLDS